MVQDATLISQLSKLEHKVDYNISLKNVCQKCKLNMSNILHYMVKVTLKDLPVNTKLHLLINSVMELQTEDVQLEFQLIPKT